MARYQFGFVALLLILSLSAFMLYVPLMSLAVVALLAIGMAVTFRLGVYMGMAEASEQRSWARKREHRAPAGRATFGLLSGSGTQMASGAR